jgi:hypothetical protein
MNVKFKSLIRRIISFVRRLKWKEIFIFLFFLFLSFGFWFLQTLQEDYERRIELPLRIKNIPVNSVVSDETPKILNIVVKDKGSNIIYYTWRKNFFPVDVYLPENFTSPSYPNNIKISRTTLEAALSKQLLSSTSIISIEPYELSIKIENLVDKDVSIIPDLYIQTKQGFQVSDTIRLSNGKVKLYGNMKHLDTIDYIKTKQIKLKNVDKSKDLTVDLVIPEGLKADRESVKVSIPVEEFTEKRIQLPVQAYDIPSNFILRIFPSDVEVICNIPISKYKELTSGELSVEIPFDDFRQKQQTGKLTLNLSHKPSWVVDPVIVPDEVEFIIEQIKND